MINHKATIVNGSRGIKTQKIVAEKAGMVAEILSGTLKFLFGTLTLLIWYIKLFVCATPSK
jgi:hypothetical protein